MKHWILIRLVQLLTRLRKWCISQLPETPEVRRPLRTTPRDRTERPERRSRTVREYRARQPRKFVDNYDNLLDDENIPQEDATE